MQPRCLHDLALEHSARPVSDVNRLRLSRQPSLRMQQPHDSGGNVAPLVVL